MIRFSGPGHNLDWYDSSTCQKDDRERPRFQYSLRTLLLLTLGVALLLVPVAWVSRERQQMIQARAAILEAREAALRSVVLEEQQRLNQGRSAAREMDSSVLKRLERENTSLRQQVDELRREIVKLRNPPMPLGTTGR